MWEYWTVQNKTKYMDASHTQKQILFVRTLWWKIHFCRWFILCLLAIWEGRLSSFTTPSCCLPTWTNSCPSLTRISRCWTVSGGFFCCHLSLHSCTLESVKNPSPDISWIAVARPQRWACHLATAGCWFRGVPERYVAGADTRGRQEGWPYLWSQQVIHEMSGLKKKYERKFAGK